MGAQDQGLTWMTPATKTRALAKLQNLRVEVGGQTPPRDYSSLAGEPGEAFENLLRAQDFSRARILARLGRPVDRGELVDEPADINAQSNFDLCEGDVPGRLPAAAELRPLCGPGGELRRESPEGDRPRDQPPFDDQGSKFDAAGALDNWWGAGGPSAVSRRPQRRWRRSTTPMSPCPACHINGRLTLGENIGDLAGLAISLDAYHASLAASRRRCWPG